METPGITLNLKKGNIRCKRKASGLLYIEADDQSCSLYFKNGEVFFSGYNLKYYEKKLLCMRIFIRVHRSYLINLLEADNCTYLVAVMSDGKQIPLNDYGYSIVKEFVDKKNSDSPSAVA